MVQTAYIKYIFLDIVSYSYNRTIEAQTEIISNLNKIVEDTVNDFSLQENILYLPTGDGICICIINLLDPYDIHMQIAIKILEKLDNYNTDTDDTMRQFKIRIGINENDDNLIIDINKNKNVAGAGINYAQRIMDCAFDNQIVVGENVFSKLNQREKYNESFIPFTKKIKHNLDLNVYRYINNELLFLNNFIEKENDSKLRLSQFIKNYISIIEIFKDKIYEIAGHSTNSYVLFLLMCWITHDLLNHKNSSEIGRRNGYDNKLFSSQYSFEYYFDKINNSDNELVFSTYYYYRNIHNFNKYDKYFSDTDLILINKNDTQLANLPDLIKENKEILLAKQPGLFE